MVAPDSRRSENFSNRNDGKASLELSSFGCTPQRMTALIPLRFVPLAVREQVNDDIRIDNVPIELSHGASLSPSRQSSYLQSNQDLAFLRPQLQ